MQKKRNKILLAILLLVAAALLYFYFCNNSDVQKNFVQQGSTTINYSEPVIKIWDYSAVDGDTIDFYFDGKLIFKNMGLEDSPFIFRPGSLSKGEHIIGVKGINEGTMGPASPHLSISDGKEKFEFDIDAWKDSASGSWLIIVK
ncbi:MAG: hypothetical protein ABIR78_03945 [Ferruginibacter sp.]